ncbi:TPM domain-containing protein [Enterococcus sp. 669A]|uniref:TPM domain-containing protein n=1 Tax=Candidatus Enterococcus moelleringii TaxID=2815325 RepID=A0ABS3L674_9ENTE|nr:TPM domain-containing protein [Enterococcus sp. 669A]MBO1305125.1 TPM domain-containing protein [Enterococcus sp. 669A]
MRKLAWFFGLLLFFLPMNAWAADDTVTDEAGLFTPDQQVELGSLADTLNEKIKGETFVLTTNSNTEDPQLFANQQLKARVGEDGNGALLLLDMGQRELYLTYSGNMIDFISDRRRDNILDSVQDAMQDGNYYQAAESYFTEAAEYVDDGVPGGHFRIDGETGEVTIYKAITGLEAAIAIGIALIAAIAFFVVTRMRYQLKLGTYRYPYREHAHLELDERKDQLVNSFVTTRRIPKPSNNGGGMGGGGSTTNSSGGGTFGGGGRGF